MLLNMIWYSLFLNWAYVKTDTVIIDDAGDVTDTPQRLTVFILI